MANPIYDAYILDEWDGIMAISLVHDPAVDSLFTAFNKQEKRVEVMYNITNEEQRRVLGVVMRANYPIYRKNDEMGEFYIRYSPDTIRKMAQKMFLMGTQNCINLDHDPNCFVEGVRCEEVFIKNTATGITPIGFEDIDDGSMFATFKIEDEQIWEMIKAGEYRGFSLEGYFTLKDANELYKKQNNKEKSAMSKIKEALKKLLAEMGMIATDNGNLNYEGDEIAVGIEVTDDEGNPVADGEYKTEDGKVIVVKDGKVAEINDAEPVEEKPVEEPVEEKPVEGEDEEPVEEPTEEPTEEPKEDELNAKIDAMQAEIDALKAAIEEIKGQLNAPVAEPVAEVFEKSAIVTGKNKAAEYAKYLKD